MAVTRRQKEVLDFVSDFERKNGYSASYQEIADGLGLKSLATVHKHVKNLEQKGMIERAENRSRSIDVIPQSRRNKIVDRLPLVGQIAAGLPVETTQNVETLSLGDIVGSKEAFALKVRGDSMRDEHIVDGDFVVVEKTSVARQGEIVVALVKGSETTLKRYYVEGPLVRLQPSNTEMDPIYVPIQNVAIQGKVLGVIRKYA
jgi:repressor LexA